MREDHVPCCQVDFWVFIVISLILVSLAGIASGLALGLLSFSKVDLEVLIRSGQPKDQKNAATILPLVKNEHLLLCTLLIVKSLAMEALPIFVDSILPVWAAILVSGTLVVAVTEMLDCLLGKEHSALLRRAELKTLVDLHANEAGKGGDLSHHETTIIGGALDLTQKTAEDAMTPISETFSLDINSKLDMNTLGSIMSRGHSRVPIYSGNPNNIIGLILAKNLIFCRPEDETPVKYMTIRRIPRVYSNWPLYDILNQFPKGHSHMAAVVRNKKDVNGQREIDARSSRLDSVRAESKGLNSPINGKEHPSNAIDISSVYSSESTEYSTPLSEYVMEQDEDLTQTHYKRHKKQGGGNVSNESVGSIQSHLDEEVIGIITMEDVMEELLQEDILDETDEYVDVHNRQSSPWKLKTPALHPTSLQSLPLPKRAHHHIQPHANSSKGFGNNTPAATMKERPSSKNPKNDDEIPQVVTERMLVRIVAAVGLPLATGIAFLNVFEYIKENHLWDVPVWLPFLTTLLTFGTSALGIAYGALSTSWDAEKKGSILGFEEAQKNWVDMWREEDEGSS
ncbi:hypothetical protein ACLB2K_075701 [Fragaria x ananassa]